MRDSHSGMFTGLDADGASSGRSAAGWAQSVATDTLTIAVQVPAGCATRAGETVEPDRCIRPPWPALGEPHAATAVISPAAAVALARRAMLGTSAASQAS